MESSKSWIIHAKLTLFNIATSRAGRQGVRKLIKKNPVRTAWPGPGSCRRSLVTYNYLAKSFCILASAPSGTGFNLTSLTTSFPSLRSMMVTFLLAFDSIDRMYSFRSVMSMLLTFFTISPLKISAEKAGDPFITAITNTPLLLPIFCLNSGGKSLPSIPDICPFIFTQ